MSQNKTIDEIKRDKYKKIMYIVGIHGQFYRKNPQRFVEDILHIKLKLFQKILIWAMMRYNYFLWIAARGISKSYLTAIFCVTRCVLYPGTKIIVASGTKAQADEVLLKVQDEIMPNSAILRTEITKCSVGQNKSIILFKNGSWIRTIAPNDNARSLRANIVVMDEFRMIDKEIADNVILPFLAAPRQPKYLNKPEYADLQEPNKEIYMSSGWYKDHWSWKKCQAYTLNMFRSDEYFIASNPYQLSIKERLLRRQQIQNKMSEADFNETNFSMEYGGVFIGDDGNSFFSLEDINKNRTIEKVLYPLEFYDDKNPVPQPLTSGKRILSLDIALMASTKKKKNDASALYINDLTLINDTTYQSNIVYGETFEGLTTDQLGQIVMRYFYEYHCTDVVIDTNGVGIGVYDYIIKNHYDSVTGKQYDALNCCNDNSMSERCQVSSAKKVVWSVKATRQFNNLICTSLRNGIRSGKILFPKNELVVEEYLIENCKGYKNMTPTRQMKIKMAYFQTTLASLEMIKLRNYHDNNGNIILKEHSGMRKDRYSSLAYNYWVACQLELQLKPKITDTQTLVDKMIVRRGKFRGRYI